jgi:TolB protein
LRAEGEPGVDIASAAALAAPGPIAIREAGVAFRVFFVDVASGEIRGERDLAISELYAFQVVPFFDQYALSHRTWAPDGSAITLPLVDAAGRSRVMVVPADGSEPRFVADGIIGFWRP